MRTAIIKKIDHTKHWQGCGGCNSQTLLVARKKWYNQFGSFLTMLILNLPYDPAIALLSIYPVGNTRERKHIFM